MLNKFSFIKFNAILKKTAITQPDQMNDPSI